MYQLISAIGIADNFDGRYQPIDISQTTLVEVFKTYSNVFATLVRQSDNVEVALDLYKLPVGTRLLNQTLPQFLVHNGNKTLPTETLPEITYQHVRYYSLWQSEFTIKPSNRNFHPDYELAIDQQTDVIASKPNLDYIKLINNSLFTVNGFIHRADYTPEGISIFDALVSKRIANDTHLGLLDFSLLGGIEIVDVSNENLYKRHNGQPYSQAAYIKLPEPLGDRTPLLVLGGYLHALDPIYSMVSDTVMKVDFSRYAWLKRYFTLRHQIDLDSLGIEPLSNGTYNIDQMASDEVIEALFNLSQTFIVLVKTNELRRGTVDLEDTKLPGVYQSSNRPFTPMIIDDGRLADYVVSSEHGKYVLRVSHYLTDNRVLETTDYLKYSQTAPLNISAKPVSLAKAQLLLLSRTVGD